MRAALVVFAVCLSATSAWASEAHAPGLSGVLFPVINFLIFLYLIKRFGLPLVRAHFDHRHEEIRRAVAEAAAERERAESRVRDYRSRLAGLQNEIRKIHEGFIAEGQREKARLIQEGEAQAAKVRADADFLAGQELKVAQLELRRFMASTARAAAEQLIRSRLTPEDDKRLIDEFVSGLGGAR
ncbi:MAG TPA: hypothetical protein VNL14_13520 [Candidatus Acidoferrales bacterium]|nr:hypothetical protein [Candidatus Acidoferrales bacterium]